jgi:hypothetical protein
MLQGPNLVLETEVPKLLAIMRLRCCVKTLREENKVSKSCPCA